MWKKEQQPQANGDIKQYTVHLVRKDFNQKHKEKNRRINLRTIFEKGLNIIFVGHVGDMKTAIKVMNYYI